MQKFIVYASITKETEKAVEATSFHEAAETVKAALPKGYKIEFVETETEGRHVIGISQVSGKLILDGDEYVDGGSGMFWLRSENDQMVNYPF